MLATLMNFHNFASFRELKYIFNDQFIKIKKQNLKSQRKIRRHKKNLSVSASIQLIVNIVLHSETENEF